MGGSKAVTRGGESAGTGRDGLASGRARTLVVLREIVGMSQRDLAARIGVSEKVLSRWSNGRGEPDADELARYLEALGHDFAVYQLMLDTIDTIDSLRAGADDEATEAALRDRYAQRTGLLAERLVRYLVTTRGGRLGEPPG